MTVYRRPGPGQSKDTPTRDRTGPWEVKVRDARGKQVVRRLDERTGEPFRGLRHAEKFETWLSNELLTPAPASNPAASLRELARRAWTDHYEPNTAPTTRANTRRHLDKRVLPVPVTLPDSRVVPLGDVEVGDITAGLVAQWLAKLHADGDNPPTRNAARAVLSTILGLGVRWDVIPANPCAAIPRAREMKRARRYLTPSEVDAIATETRTHRDHAMVLVGAYTGLRPSELLGLAVEHIHLDAPAPSLYVAWQLSEPTTKDRKRILHPRLVKPKDHEQRSIELTDELVRVLRDYLACDDARPHMTTPDGGSVHLAFAQADGTPLTLRSWRRSCFWPAATRAGLAEPVLDADGSAVMTKAIPGQRHARPMTRALVSPNDLRHFYPSFLRALDPPAPPEYVSTRMGHSDPAFTMKTYGDLFATPAAPVVAAMNAARA